METSSETCADCGGNVYEIKLVDRRHGNFHGDLEYTSPEEKRGFLSGRFPVKGHIAATMCESCGRVALYGVPAE